MTRHLNAALLGGLLLAAAPVWADDAITGTYALEGQRRDGGSYSGQVRIDRDGDDLVLTTTFEDALTRAQARGSAEPLADGCWVLRLPSSEGAVRGATDALDGLLEGRRPEAPETNAIRVKRSGDRLLAYVREGGRTVARERYTLRTADGLTVTALQPRQRRFVPHHPTGQNSVSVRYRLQPANVAMTLTVEVHDKDGRRVHHEETDGVEDTGEGRVFEWTGYTGRQGYVDARKSPYTITISATHEDETAHSNPVEVVALPLIDRCWVVSRTSASETLSSSNKVVDYDSRTQITGVVRAIVGGVRAAERGRTDRAYFVLTADATRAEIAGIGRVSLERWDAALWSDLDLFWQTILPRGLHAPAYTDTQNSRRQTRDGEFTNVVSNGDQEGRWLGIDTIEYLHSDAGTGPSPRADMDPGTVRYRFDANYRDADLRLDDADAPGTLGKRGTRSTTSTRVFSALEAAAFDRNLGAISDRVHRISRKGNNASPLLAALETYRRVPWIYGSLSRQVRSFIGYDCADLALGAARIAGLSQHTQFTNANNLCKVYTRAVGAHPVLQWDSNGRSIDLSTREEHRVTFGGSDSANAQAGDIVFFDWDGDGHWDHTTILYSCPSGSLDATSRLAWAHHDSRSTDGFAVGTLGDLIRGDRTKIRTRIRRF